MLTLTVLAVVLVIGLLSYVLGWSKARSAAARAGVRLHSRVGFYGTYNAFWSVLPALGVLAIWAAIQPMVISSLVQQDLPENVRTLDEDRLGLIVGQIRSIASGGIATTTEEFVREAAERWKSLSGTASLGMVIAVVVVALIGGLYGRTRIGPALRARNHVESVVKIGLIICSSIAILTTIGIVLSVLFEALHFFSYIPPLEFFFGLVWDPRFAGAGSSQEYGQFGLIPLLWGTLLISIIALLVSVPIGLFTAIYLAEYAGGKVRGTVKPLIEILAGIPTVVYGFFALITVGPFLRDFGATLGLSVDANSALTAGLVMGIMIIPFVSSLSDDIINAVPQSLRDGSYALGATKSETVKRVILPAALPGIVGAVLLAASRAIGETMIVVMAAGVAANLTANPFEAVTTVTVKIVNQLTGDQEFTSPQSLVAFALGLTLFVITLGLNIFALHIVRKYREQYE